ncbi:MAG: small acid-soluble spore protein SspI [bacterium]|nr:small acid-soluble spore protein SspI [bacterium]
MEIDIRKNIINNLKNEDVNGIISIIDESITSKDELVLPGLGVILEILWNDLDSNYKETLANTLIKKIN